MISHARAALVASALVSASALALAQGTPTPVKPTSLAGARSTALGPARAEAAVERVEPNRVEAVQADTKYQVRELPRLSRQTPAPRIAVPTGYGNYCSGTVPDGGWAFITLTGSSANPCKDVLAIKGATIERAGLWAENADNTVVARCAGNVLIMHKGNGSAPTAAAFAEAQGKKSCVFTVAPGRLPIFDRPYGKKPGKTNADDGVQHGTGFDFAMSGSLDVQMFGQAASPTKASIVDHLGRAKSDNFINGHDAHDWSMETGRVLLAVADGIVRRARHRDVKYYCTPNGDQAEIYIEHRVGEGLYAERFVSYYAHMSDMLVKDGDVVTRGQVIGKAGTSGCSSGPHLHLGVTRLTNGSSYRHLDFQVIDLDHGDTGFAGRIEPYGWKAPQHVDPWAWRYLDKNLGALSIDLWRDGQAPTNPNF